MKRVKKILTVVIILLAAGCKKSEQYSDIPSIAFKSISLVKDASGFDTKAHLVISFTDGDGDLGYRSSGNGSPYDDTLSVYFNNFIIKQFDKKNGIWHADTINLSGRMPWMTPEGSNKSLKGEISMDAFLPLAANHDTIRYDIFIYDRALHQSNTVTTSEIIIRTH